MNERDKGALIGLLVAIRENATAAIRMLQAPEGAAKVKCPNCDSTENAQVESYGDDEVRVCANCGHNWTPD